MTHYRTDRSAWLQTWIVLLCFSAGLLLLLMGCGAKRPNPGIPETLDFRSSDAELVSRFQWARDHALSLVGEDDDPVGPWYEAALPGREAFCMRDVSHQAVGAHALGLASHTKNMLRKFAVNISESKDWCSFWEINRHDRPAPVDYRNDKEFWYNLPANFDVLDACRRMFQWTGDASYLEDTEFLNFHARTVTDFVDRWDLSLEKTPTRKRFMNRESYDPEDAYQYCRGIPSYHEGEPGKTQIGVDLLAFQAAAYRSYARMLTLRGDQEQALSYEKKSEDVIRFITSNFWDDEAGRFHSLRLTDGTYGDGGWMQVYLLYNDALLSREKIAKTLQYLFEGPMPNIEIASHLPEIYYRYGAHEDAYRMIMKLSDPSMKRREYPEVSFALIGALVQGMMGVEPMEREDGIATLSRLTDETEWAELRSLPVRGNLIDIRHNGREETVLTNRSGVGLTWLAKFYGEAADIEVGGEYPETIQGEDSGGMKWTGVWIPVDPGQRVSARVPASKF